MRSPTLQQVAWHEAGHAVVAWDRGFTVTLVSIRRIGDSYGRCQHTPAGDYAVPSERERENIVAMAGWAAELASGEANGDTYDSSDLSWLLIQLEQHAPSRIRIELGWAEREAQRRRAVVGRAEIDQGGGTDPGSGHARDACGRAREFTEVLSGTSSASAPARP